MGEIINLKRRALREEKPYSVAYFRDYPLQLNSFLFCRRYKTLEAADKAMQDEKQQWFPVFIYHSAKKEIVKKPETKYYDPEAVLPEYLTIYEEDY